MKIPVEWLKEYINTNKSSKELADSFTTLGLMLDRPIQKYTEGTYETDVLDLEHRMDRSDWLAILGCARDLAAYENIEFKLPQMHSEAGKPAQRDLAIEVKVECPDLVNRFNTRTFRNITVKPSPDWLKNRLLSYGIPSINNIVDITNYVMVEFGQPMHAQDIDKMTKPEIVIRKARVGETITTLLGENVKIANTEAECQNTFVLTQDDVSTVLGGIVGGRATAVDETTKNIVLDAGNYNQTAIRKTSRRLKIQNETVLRYDKYLHPKLTELAINRATYLILELAGGEYYENSDWYPNPVETKDFILSYDRLLQIGGLEIEASKVKSILHALEYRILGETDTQLKVQIPYFRTDIEVEDDIVADILRINSYSKIPSAQVNAAPPKEITPKIYKFEQKIREIAVRLGLHEFVTDPFVDHDESNKEQITLENFASSVKNSLRTNLSATLAPVLETYQKQKIQSAGVFEIGNIYKTKKQGSANYSDYEETRVLEVIYTNSDFNTNQTAQHVKGLLAAFLQNIGISNYLGKKNLESVSLFVNDLEVGQIRWNSFTLYTQVLLNLEAPTKRILLDIQNLSDDDISLIINSKQELGEIYKYIKDFSENINTVEILEEYKDSTIGQDKKAVLFRITYENKFDKDELIKGLANKYGIEIRS